MRTKFILFCFLLFAGIASAQVKRVAILETVDKEGKITYANKLILRSNLSKAITNTAGYEAYDRTDIDAIMGEQDFQRTGMVSNDQIKKLGEMTGANYILVAEAVVIDASNMFITAKLLDVETARTILTDNVMMGTSPEKIQQGCIALANKLFNSKTTYIPASYSEPVSTPQQTISSKKDNSQHSPAPVMNNDNTIVKSPIVSSSDMLVINSKQEQRMYGLKKYSYGNTQMDEKALKDFLRKNDEMAYKRYLKNQKMKLAGWSALGSGVGLIFVGALCHLDYSMDSYTYTDYSYNYYYDYYYENTYTNTSYNSFAAGDVAGLCLWPIGIVLTATAIPLLCLAYSPKKSAINVFNNNHSRPAITLNVTTNKNGIGLALNF